MNILKEKSKKIIYTLTLSFGPNNIEEYKKYSNNREKIQKKIISSLFDYLSSEYYFIYSQRRTKASKLLDALDINNIGERQIILCYKKDNNISCSVVLHNYYDEGQTIVFESEYEEVIDYINNWNEQ